MIPYVELWKIQAIKMQNYVEETIVKETGQYFFLTMQKEKSSIIQTSLSP